MDAKVNASILTLDGFVQLRRYSHLYFVAILTVFILILCSNCTIVCLIVSQRSLHEPMYVFIAALLVNSVVYSLLLYPKLLLDVVSDRQTVSYSLCIFQWFVFYDLGSSEFLLLAAMALDRYLSICRPLRYSAVMRRSTVQVLLVWSWLLPAGLMLVPAVLNSKQKLCEFSFRGIICNSTVSRLHCVRSRALDVYGLLLLVVLVLLPVLAILFTYSRILLVSYRSPGDVRSKAAQTCLPHLLVLLNFTCLSVFDVLLLRLDSEVPPVLRLVLTLLIVMNHPLFNPVIYGLKMREIHRQLKRLFRRVL